MSVGSEVECLSPKLNLVRSHWQIGEVFGAKPASHLVIHLAFHGECSGCANMGMGWNDCEVLGESRTRKERLCWCLLGRDGWRMMGRMVI